MKVLIDGDACGTTRRLVNKFRNKYDVHIYCDVNHLQRYYGAETHYVDRGRDSADRAILNGITPGDIVFTADMGLASLCAVRGALIYNFQGHPLTEKDLEAALVGRYIRNSIRRRSRKGNGHNRKMANQMAYIY